MTDLMPTPKVNPFDSRKVPAITAQVAAEMIPSFNFQKAVDAGIGQRFLINTWGGLGDQICAEPAIRFGMKNFRGVEWHLASRCPSLYKHLSWASVTDTRVSEPAWGEYNNFQTVTAPDHMIWEYMSHALMHCVDYSALCMFRMMLPNADKEIQLPDFKTENDLVNLITGPAKKTFVVVHAGRHWPSKTFPKAWWDEVVGKLKRCGFKPVLIGATVTKDIGYVDVDPTDCVDLRDRLTIPEFIELLKGCSFLLSNDSSPIHAAAAGHAFIGMLASCKHPDFLTHWRLGRFGFRTKNLSKDGAWNHLDYSPVRIGDDLQIEHLPVALMEKILPTADFVAYNFTVARDTLY